MKEGRGPSVRFLKVGGAGKETVECELGEQLGRQAFQGPNTVSRALFSVGVAADGQAVLECVSDASRLMVSSAGGKQTALRKSGERCAVAGGDEVWLLGPASPDFRYVFDMDAEAAAKRAKTAPVEEKRQEKAGVAAAAVAPPSPPLGRAVSKEPFVPSPLKFYRNPSRLPGCDNSRNTLDLRPFFGESGLERVALASYELDAAWLLSFYPVLSRVPVAAACPGSPHPCPGNWRHVRPDTLQYGTAHGKLCLLFFPRHIRVIILSGNLQFGDQYLSANSVSARIRNRLAKCC
jgi:hypothetical protein